VSYNASVVKNTAPQVAQCVLKTKMFSSTLKNALAYLCSTTPAMKLEMQRPSIVSYNDSVVKVYNAPSNLVRSEDKKRMSPTLKNALAYYNAL
jgi:hypothetical protein